MSKLIPSVNLQCEYTVWFHSSSDNDWSISSYHEIINFVSVKDFWLVTDCILSKSKMLLNGMFFIMKKGIKPIWEDPENTNGGYISWKLEKEDVTSAWENLSSLFVIGDLGDFTQFKPTGISISPKKNNNIIKLWVADDISADKFDNVKLSDNCIFKDYLKLYKSHTVLT